MSDNIFIDLVEPTKDLNESLDLLSKDIGALYAKAWAAKQQFYEDKPFDLHVAAFTNMWFDGTIKIFAAYDTATHEPKGFIVGTMFRPLPYKASVFQVQECYADNKELKQDLLNHAVQAIRVLGCTEIWVQKEATDVTPLLKGWRTTGNFTIVRYSKE